MVKESEVQKQWKVQTRYVYEFWQTCSEPLTNCGLITRLPTRRRKEEEEEGEEGRERRKEKVTNLEYFYNEIIKKQRKQEW